MFLIYLLTNPRTGLSYVGYTKDLKRRLAKHKYLFTVDCKDFTNKIVFDGIPTRAEAQEMEKVFIDVYGTYDNGYNKTRGGSTGTELSDETKQKISETLTGATFTEEHKQNISENHALYWQGKTHSEETKQKMGESRKGEKHFAYGKTFSDETKDKMALAKRKPEYDDAKNLFHSLSGMMTLRQKRKELRERYPHIPNNTICRWVRDWTETTTPKAKPTKLVKIP